MKEDFLYFIWQFQYFDKKQLYSTQGKKIEIIEIGKANKADGPDFSLAKIRIDGLEWVGDVEIHSKASEWNLHQHNKNLKYNNVILHVVESYDAEVYRYDKTLIPTLEIGKWIFPKIQQKYFQLLQNPQEIPCQNQIQEVSHLQKVQMLDKVLVRRLERKAHLLKNIYLETGKDWEEMTYRALAQNFGFKANTSAFESLAKSLPLKILLKHQHQFLQIEALIFGQAGFLSQIPAPEDEYFLKLKKEYGFLQKKYALSPIQVNIWQKARIRPANFPSLRLAQFAGILSNYQNLFSLFLEKNLKELKEIFSSEVSEYWKKNYDFAKPSKKENRGLGKNSIENIIINTVVGVLVLYAKERQKQGLMDKTLNLLEQLPSEKNHILDKWKSLGFEVKTAFDSQALIELYREFCQKKSCLKCSIGQELLKS